MESKGQPEKNEKDAGRLEMGDTQLSEWSEERMELLLPEDRGGWKEFMCPLRQAIPRRTARRRPSEQKRKEGEGREEGLRGPSSTLKLSLSVSRCVHGAGLLPPGYVT